MNEPKDLIDAARRVCWLLKIARDEEDLITGRTRPQGAAGAAPAAGEAEGADATEGAGPVPAGTPSIGASSTELPLAGASEEATTPAVASSGRSCPRDKPPTAVPSPGASSNSASSAGAPSSSASAAGTSAADAPFTRRSVTEPADLPGTDRPRARGSAARSTLADAAAADAALAGAPPPQTLPATTSRGPWRERVSPDAMLWSGTSPARPCHPIRNGSRPDWHSGQFGPR